MNFYGSGAIPPDAIDRGFSPSSTDAILPQSNEHPSNDSDIPSQPYESLDFRSTSSESEESESESRRIPDYSYPKVPTPDWTTFFAKAPPLNVGGQQNSDSQQSASDSQQNYVERRATNVEIDWEPKGT